MSQCAVAPVLLLLLSLATSATAQLLPQPPRHGKNTVQMIVGGTDKIPMCIVPPRAYVDGSPIPPGTPCEIKVYRSREDGKPGSYTELVGSANGQVTRPDDLQAWIDVAAKAGPEPGKQAVYLASSATVAGQESDLNNQWTTIVWAPGNFSVKEYPAAGSNPGPPPNRGNRAPSGGAKSYPDWILETSAGDGGGAARPWQLMAPSVADWSTREDPQALNLPLTFTVDPDHIVSGSLDNELLTAQVREYDNNFHPELKIKPNLLTGRFDGQALEAEHLLGITLRRDFGADGVSEYRISAQTTFQGRRQGDSITGIARTLGKWYQNGGVAMDVDKSWHFEAKPAGASGDAPKVRLVGAPFSSEFGLPGPRFAVPALAAGRAIKSQLLRCLVGVETMSVGDSHYFSNTRTPRVKMIEDQRVPLVGVTTREPGHTPEYCTGPLNVLSEEPVGDGVRVRAIGEGVGEVWIKTRWLTTAADGTQDAGPMVETWIVLVGSAAIEAYLKSQELSLPLAAEQGPINAGTLRGRVLGPGGQPLAGAKVSLRHVATGGGYSGPDWDTRADGAFVLDLAQEYSYLGLQTGRYQVMPFLRDESTTASDNRNDLWPANEVYVDLTVDSAKAGITLAEPIIMARVGLLYDLD